MRLCRIPPALLLGTVILLPGCGKPKPPPVVPVDGTVYLDDKPLAFARVDFIPMLEHFGAEMNSFGVTDENGRFTLTCLNQNQAGAVVGEHRVLVGEHAPAEARGFDAESQRKLNDYLSKLTNRPIPRVYSELSQRKITVEVKAGQTTYDLRLTRSAK